MELTICVMMVAKGLPTPPAPGTTSKTDDGVVVAMVVPALVVVVVTPPILVLARRMTGASYLMRCITPNVAISAYRRSVHPALASARESALAPGPV